MTQPKPREIKHAKRSLQGSVDFRGSPHAKKNQEAREVFKGQERVFKAMTVLEVKWEKGRTCRKKCGQR
jgi:hypothetical protein